MNKENLNLAFKASLPALFGYVSLGISFGFFFQKISLVWYLAPLMSLFVYAGASQFVAVTLIADHAPMMQILIATFVINLRHVFYGISFLGKFPKKFFKKMYMIFGLTDETYSILTSMPDKKNENFQFYLMIFAHFYWVLGSFIGALLGKILPIDLKFLEFSLTALFIILSIEQWYAIKKIYPFLIAIIVSIIGFYIYPSQMLIIAMSMATLIICGLHYLGFIRHDN